MYRKSGGNDSKQCKMAAESNRDIRYKPIAGRLHEHFGVKLSVDRTIENAVCLRSWLSDDI